MGNSRTLRRAFEKFTHSDFNLPILQLLGIIQRSSLVPAPCADVMQPSLNLLTIFLRPIVLHHLTRQNPPVPFLFQKETAGPVSKSSANASDVPSGLQCPPPPGSKTLHREKLPVLFRRDGKLPFPGRAPYPKYPQTAQENPGKTAVQQRPHISCALGTT